MAFATTECLVLSTCRDNATMYVVTDLLLTGGRCDSALEQGRRELV